MGVAKETVTRNFADNSCVRPEIKAILVTNLHIYNIDKFKIL